MPCARFVSVSELLGDADQRYFSAGYRAVRQDLRGIRLYTDDHGAIRVGASLALSYPQSWSQKAGQEDRRPHLSTLDALLVASQLTEVILLEALSLPRELRQWVWIRRAVIRAGAKAVEELDDVEVRGQLISGDAELSPLFRHTRLVKTRFSIGALRVELDLIVPEARPCDTARAYSSIDDALGQRAQRYYGDGFKADDISIGDGWLLDEKAIHVPIERRNESKYIDLGSSYVGAPTFVNCILGQAQISQLMLYSLDHMDRSISDNLWMRHVEMISSVPHGGTQDGFHASAHIDKTRLLPMAGRTWRITDFPGKFGPITARYNLAHALPEEKAQATR